MKLFWSSDSVSPYTPWEKKDEAILNRNEREKKRKTMYTTSFRLMKWDRQMN